MKKRQKVITLGGSLLAITAVSTVVLTLVLRQTSIIPESILKQVTSTVFIPNQKLYKADAESVKYNAVDKLLTYSVQVNNSPCVFSLQPTPEQFVDIPQTFDLFISQSNKYDSFDSVNGRVNIIKPKGVANAAVMDAKGSLMFIKCDQKLTGTQWRQLLNSLYIVK